MMTRKHPLLLLGIEGFCGKKWKGDWPAMNTILSQNTLLSKNWKTFSIKSTFATVQIENVKITYCYIWKLSFDVDDKSREKCVLGKYVYGAGTRHVGSQHCACYYKTRRDIGSGTVQKAWLRALGTEWLGLIEWFICKLFFVVYLTTSSDFSVVVVQTVLHCSTAVLLRQI